MQWTQLYSWEFFKALRIFKPRYHLSGGNSGYRLLLDVKVTEYQSSDILFGPLKVGLVILYNFLTACLQWPARQRKPFVSEKGSNYGSYGYAYRSTIGHGPHKPLSCLATLYVCRAPEAQAVQQPLCPWVKKLHTTYLQKDHKYHI